MVALVGLRSKRYGKFLRLDGTGLNKFQPSGGGTAGTQSFIEVQETFYLIENTDGTVSFESTGFAKVFLRLDGSGVTAGVITPPGGGVVNGQFGSITLERFKIVKKGRDGIVGIESNSFPGRFLRMNGDKNEVNVQGQLGPSEEWEILVVGRA